MNTTCYLSGPMTDIPEFNVPAFAHAARVLRERDFTVINPAEAFGGDTTRAWSCYIRHDIAALLRVDEVRVLPGWEMSRGARLEVCVAQALGMPVLAWDTGEPITACVTTGVEVTP